MEPGPSFLDALELAADRATAAESDFRRGIAERIKALEGERAFAFRRLNLMRAIADVIAGVESEEIAVAGAGAVLRAKLGWSSESEARTAVVSRFAPVAQVMFASLAHVPAKWTPVRRQEHAPINSAGACPDSKGAEEALAPSEDEDAPRPDVIRALTEFETWYAQTHPGPFWSLFENYMPETPVVDF